MNTLNFFSFTFWRIMLTVLLIAVAFGIHAQTYWTGSNITFTNAGNGATDTLTPIVILTRRTIQNGGGLYNAANESQPTKGISPNGTLWARGTLAQYMTSTNGFSFGACPLEGPNGDPSQYIGDPFVVYLVTNNIYLQLTLTAWGGEFQSLPLSYAYTRSTPAVVPPTPTVSITNPAANAVFAAPANVQITASAGVSSGTVTNVQFFANSVSVGSVTTPPFSLTASALAAGAYNLTAAATAAGISATSSVVNISVVTPVAVALSNSTASSGTNFQFTYSANAGLRYVIERAASLASANWVPIATNVAASNPTNFMDTQATNNPAFYRVGLLPNP
jgi:Bacterial Ig domain